MKKLFFNIYLALFANRFFYRINKALAITGLKGMGILNYESFRVSGEEYFLNYLVKNFTLKSIFDVGANTGAWSALCRQKFPDAAIYAFEPHPLNFKKLYDNTVSVNVNSFNLGFSDNAGQFELFDYAVKDGSSHASLHEEYFSRLANEKTTSHLVPLSTIDIFMREQKIDHIDFLKIDTEGHELKVLRGALESIRENRIRVIQFEFGKYHIASKTFFKDIYDILYEKYIIYRLLPSSLLPIKQYHYLLNEIFAYQNYVAILK